MHEFLHHLINNIIDLFVISIIYVRTYISSTHLKFYFRAQNTSDELVGQQTTLMKKLHTGMLLVDYF